MLGSFGHCSRVVAAGPLEALELEKSRWDTEHPLSKRQEHLWKLYDLCVCGQNTLPKHMLSVKDVLALVTPSPIVPEQLIVWCVY